MAAKVKLDLTEVKFGICTAGIIGQMPFLSPDHNSLFHSQLKTYLFHKSFPTPIDSFLTLYCPDAIHGLPSRPFLLSYLFFSFFFTFFRFWCRALDIAGPSISF